MPRNRLLWHLFPSYLSITILVLLALGLYGRCSLSRFYYDHVAKDLQARARLIEEQLAGPFELHDFEAIDEQCKKLGRLTDTRITFVLPDGVVVGDSDEDPKLMKNHSDRPEIVRALEQGSGRSVRFSNTLGKKMMYVAVSVRDEQRNLATIRASLPVTAIDEQLNSFYGKIIWALLLLVGVTVVVSLIVSRRLSRPIERMTVTARQFAAGQLDLRLPTLESGELADLAEALNEMAKQLSDRIETITRQRNGSEAILASMVEGVIAVDSSGHIVLANEAAASLLKVEHDNIQGRNIEEVVRNPELHDFIKEILEGKEPEEADVFMQSDGGRYFQLHGARLAAGKSQAGAVIVLNDMTRLRRLEQVRRDFVANVSHELKTPITSIKGFVETLLEEVADDPERSRRFLEIISRHSDRLNAIIEDLLTLSRLEAEDEQRKVTFERGKLKPAIIGAVDLSQIKAEDKKIKIEIQCDENLETRVNGPLLEQAVLNLVDNAIKYSNTGGRIEVNVSSDNDYVVISVKDNGCGMDKKHLSRIFERFYVVDKGRSRKLGGTGLGLAIVKHICQVHGGSITVESTPGVGSTFTMCLPRD